MTNYAPLALHVPEPAVRPGGAPDFSNVRISTAGAVARPDVDADPKSSVTSPTRSSGFSTGTARRSDPGPAS